MMELWELRNVFQLGGGKEVGVAVQRGGELKQLKVVLKKGT